jgi:hypothetical protein
MSTTTPGNRADARRDHVRHAVKNAFDQLNSDGVEPRNGVAPLLWTLPRLCRRMSHAPHPSPLHPGGRGDQRRIADHLDAVVARSGAMFTDLSDVTADIDAVPGAILRKAFAGEL